MTPVEKKYHWLLHFVVNDTGFATDWHTEGVFYPIWFIEDVAEALYETDGRNPGHTVGDYVELVSENLGLSS